MENKYCVKCGKLFNKPIGVRGKRWRDRKYCSLACNINSIKGWNKGRTYEVSEERKVEMAKMRRDYWDNVTDEQRKARGKKISKALKGNIPGTTFLLGEKSKIWKGEQASYNAKHKWIQKRWTKTDVCEDCGLKVLPNPKTRLKHATHWANISREYKRDRTDWKELCPKCHYYFDKKQ